MADSSKPWADEPLPLVITPMYETKKDNMLIKGATHMALLHNAILRGFNSIYLQAEHVKPQDYSNFISYSLVWAKFVQKHHDDEEGELFPKVEEVVGKPGALDKSRKEHKTFLDGLVKFISYLTPLISSPSSFSGKELITIMDSFVVAFRDHFHSEIHTIADLDNTVKPSPEATAAVGPVFAKWGKASIMSAGLTDVVPFLFLNFDRTVEDNMWTNWPPMPGPIRWGLVNIGGMWNRSLWKFASCGYDGKPQVLYALRD